MPPVHRLARALSLTVALLLLAACVAAPEPRQHQVWKGWPELGLRLRVVEPNQAPERAPQDQESLLLVVRVRPDSPAQAAGVQAGDYLLAIDDRRVTGMADSVAAMLRKRPGDSARLALLREGRLIEIPVLLDEQES